MERTDLLMKKPTIRDKNFTGCHPVIAEALKQGKEIECWVWDSSRENAVKRWIKNFQRDRKYQYISDNIPFRHVEPIYKKQVVKDPVALIQQLVKDGFEPTPNGDWLIKDFYFDSSRFFNCGKIPESGQFWKPEWLIGVEDESL